MISLSDVLVFATLLVIMMLFLRSLWRKYTPRGLAFFCLGLIGMAMMGFTGQFATAPSSATRVTAIGRCEGFRDVSQRAYTHYLFRLTLHDGSQIPLETQISPPMSNDLHSIQNGELLQVTYLDRFSAGHLGRVISLKILSGPNTGWHRAVDADWLGAWLMFPTGAIVCAYAAFQMMRNRRRNTATIVKSEDKFETIGLDS